MHSSETHHDCWVHGIDLTAVALQSRSSPVTAQTTCNVKTEMHNKEQDCQVVRMPVASHTSCTTVFTRRANGGASRGSAAAARTAVEEMARAFCLGEKAFWTHSVVNTVKK